MHGARAAVREKKARCQSSQMKPQSRVRAASMLFQLSPHWSGSVPMTSPERARRTV